MTDKFGSLLGSKLGEEQPVQPQETTDNVPQEETPSQETVETSVSTPTSDTESIWQTLGYETADALKEDFGKLSRFKDVADDEYINSALDFYRRSGDLTDFVSAKSVDWEKMPAEDVLRHNLRKQYPELSDKAFEKIYNQEVVQKFGIDPNDYDEEDIAINRELMEAEAKKIRQSEMEEQKKFGQPTAPKQQKEIEEMVNQWHQMVDSDPVFESLAETKKLEVKHGDQSFYFEVSNPKSAAEMAKDEQKFFSTLWKDGKFDSRSWAMLVEFAQDPQKFVRTLMNWGETVGVAKAESAIAGVGEPPSPGKTSNPGGTGASLLEAFRTNGKHL